MRSVHNNNNCKLVDSLKDEAIYEEEHNSDELRKNIMTQDNKN